MIKKEANNSSRLRRHMRIRKNLTGTKEMPRLDVYRSNKDIYAQVIDDITGTTLASSSSKALKLKNGGNVEAAKLVGKDIAEKCKKVKITKVAFDRGGFSYHGRVAALAESAREAGLEF
jgi:large subunit ribosomal protein L18